MHRMNTGSRAGTLWNILIWQSNLHHRYTRCSRGVSGYFDRWVSIVIETARAFPSRNRMKSRLTVANITGSRRDWMPCRMPYRCSVDGIHKSCGQQNECTPSIEALSTLLYSQSQSSNGVQLIRCSCQYARGRAVESSNDGLHTSREITQTNQARR